MSATDPEGGLDLSRLDSWTEEEAERFDDFYQRTKDGMMAGHAFWIAQDPGVLKRYRLYAIEMNAEENRAHPAVAVLSWLHLYAILGFEDGIAYQIVNARSRGDADRRTVLAVLEAAFLHSGPWGAGVVAKAAGPLIETLPDGDTTSWPPGWRIDPEAFATELDFSRPELAEDELARIEDWYRRICGFVPRHVTFLARHRPEALKAYRSRFEHAARSLPKQLLPLLQLQWQVVRGSATGIREAVALARGLEAPKSQAVDCVTRAMLYASPAAVTLVDEVAGDLFDDWPPA